MNTSQPADRQWNERSSASAGILADTDSMFQLLFERSADAIVLFDPQTGVFVDCNAAAVALMRAGSKEKLLQVSPADLSPPLQPDGQPSAEKAAEITALVQKKKHLLDIFEKLGVETRSAATLRAIEVLSAPDVRRQGQP